MEDLSHYSQLAVMFRYPSEDLKTYPEIWRSLICLYDAALIRKLDPFIAHIHERPLSCQQEYYVSTFDVQALCFLDIGYVLYSEDYKRGIFLVNIKKEQMKAANDCGTELPDHLPNILTLLPKMTDTKLAEELVYSLLIPALKEMISKFRDLNNLYKGLLEILLKIMETDFPVSSFERFDFVSRNKTNPFKDFSEVNHIPDGVKS